MAVQTIFERLDELRRRLKYVLWVHGLCWLVAVFFLSALLAGGIDWWCRLNDTGIRVILTLTILTCSGFAIWKYLWRPLTVRLTDVDLSVKIEQRHPGFEDSLSSTVQFLNSNHDQRVGSPELQREAVRQTLSQLAEVQVDRIVETQPVQRIALAAVVTCLLVGIVVGFNRADASTAINRLVFPLADVPWPKQVDLRFVNRDLKPLTDTAGTGLTAVRGDTLELFVENLRGSIPEDATLYVRRADGGVASESMRMTALWDAHGTRREIGVTSLSVSQGPLFFWARGGDCETLPVQVDVVPPPVISTFRVKVVPPEYTRQPTFRLSENVGDVQAYVGTRLILTARSNKRLRSAQIHRKGAEPVTLQVAADGRTLSGDFTVHEAGAWPWWFDLRDRQDFGNPDAPRHEIRGIPDSTPVVHFVKPGSDILVTPTARVALQVLAKDDLSLKSVQLVYQATSGPESSRQVSTGNAGNGVQHPAESETGTVSPDAASHKSGQQGAIVLYDSDRNPDTLTLDYEWDLAPHMYSPGTRVEVIAQAFDSYSLGDSHIGQSNPRVLTIVSPEEKLRELVDRQALLILDIERAEALQTTARGHVEELQVQHNRSGLLRADDIDLLKRVELDQRQLESRITDELDGLEARARAIQTERQSNHIADAESSVLLQTLTGELEFLRISALPQIRQQLTLAVKTAETPSLGTAGKTGQSLDSAAIQQETVLRTLQDVLGQLSKWRNQRNLAGDLRDLTDAQQSLAVETAETGQRIATKTASELTQQDEIDLARLAARQQQIAEHLDNFSEQLTETAGDLQEDEPEHAGTLQHAADSLSETQLPALMRQAAAAMMQKRIAVAAESQAKVIEELRKLHDVLERRDATDTESLIKQLTDSDRELAGIRTQLQDVLQKLEDTQHMSSETRRQTELETLRKTQSELLNRLEETVRRLERLQSRAKTAARRAGQRLGEAEQATADGDSGTAGRQLQETLDDIEQAQREVAAEQRIAEETLARELIEQISDRLTALRDRQKSVIEETDRLNAEYVERGNWSRTLLKSLRNLATVQQNLESETLSAAEQVQAVEILSLALRGAARSMRLATEQIRERHTGRQTVARQNQAVRRLDDILQAFRQSDATGTQSQPGQNQQPSSSGPQGEQIAVLSQLKLVRTLQADLNSRFDAVRRIRETTDSLTDVDRKELTAIAQEQAQLADLIRELTSFFSDPEETEKPEPAKTDSTPTQESP